MALSKFGKQQLLDNIVGNADMADLSDGGDMVAFLSLMFFDFADEEIDELLMNIIEVVRVSREDAEQAQQEGQREGNARKEWISEGQVQAYETLIDKLKLLRTAKRNRNDRTWTETNRIIDERSRDRRDVSEWLKTHGKR